jgi:hypothetical protein
MELKEVYKYLCTKDPRSSTYDLYQYAFEVWSEPIPEPRKDCHCDNCFYGKDKLTVEILRLNEIINKIKENINAT